MSRRIAFMFLTLILINFQFGKATFFKFTFLCDHFRNLLNGIFRIFSKQQVKFYLYTSAYSKPQKISCDKDSCNLWSTKFDPNLRTALIVHGFLNNYESSWVQELIPELFLRQNLNVIVVDWSEIFNSNYYQTAQRVVNVGIVTNQFLQQLARKTNKELKHWPYIHIMGHSLGAHVAGQIAKRIRNDVIVHRITALDPAKPYFDKEGANIKLNKKVAQFVDVIHTNCAPDQETFGLHEPVGHIDFYANGGDRQPKCDRGPILLFGLPPIPLPSIECLSITLFGSNYIDLRKNYLSRFANGDDMICDHGEAPNYFIQSINSISKFIAQKVARVPESANSDCKNCSGQDCVKMGMDSDKYTHPRYHGVYYVNTACRS